MVKKIETTKVEPVVEVKVEPKIEPVVETTVQSTGSLNEAPTFSMASKKPIGTFEERDLLYVANADPRFRYRWLSRKRLGDNGNFDEDGWEVVTTLNSGSEKTEELKQSLGFETNCSIDGTIVRGDLILGRMPKEKAESIEAFLSKKANSQADMAKRQSSIGKGFGELGNPMSMEYSKR